MRKRPELKIQEQQSEGIQIPARNSALNSFAPPSSQFSISAPSMFYTSNEFILQQQQQQLILQQQRQQQKNKLILPAFSGTGSKKNQFDMVINTGGTDGTRTINPVALQSDLFLADTLFPLQMDVEMRDSEEPLKNNPNPIPNPSISNADSHQVSHSPFEDYLAEDPLESVLSASLPDESPQNSSPVTYQGIQNISSSQMVMTKNSKKSNSSSSTAISIITSPATTSQDYIAESSSFGRGSKSLGSANANILPEDLSKHISAIEKQRKRRESHNAVERRRRDHINERIQELSILVPDCLSDSLKMNKGSILKKTTEYVRYLQNVNMELCNRVDLLEKQLQELQRRKSEGNDSISTTKDMK